MESNSWFAAIVAKFCPCDEFTHVGSCVEIAKETLGDNIPRLLHGEKRKQNLVLPLQDNVTDVRMYVTMMGNTLSL
jgi:hypothetical protein